MSRRRRRFCWVRFPREEALFTSPIRWLSAVLAAIVAMPYRLRVPGEFLMKRFANLGLAGAITLSAGCASLNPASRADLPKCQKLPAAKIGLQMYSLLPLISGRMAATSGGEAALLEKVHAIGFRNIETYNISTGGLAEAVQRLGMKIVGSHGTIRLATFQAYIDRAKAQGQTYIGSGDFGVPGFATLEQTLQTAANLNQLGQMARAAGMTFYVHNHDPQFATKYPYAATPGGAPVPTSVWEIIAANTDPRYVSFEIDVHWARRGMGVEKVDELLSFLRKYRSRIVMLHVKDTSADGAMAELGQGSTDWRRVYEAAGPQIAYYLWEHDPPNNPDPLKSAQMGYDFLTCKA